MGRHREKMVVYEPEKSQLYCYLSFLASSFQNNEPMKLCCWSPRLWCFVTRVLAN